MRPFRGNCQQVAIMECQLIASGMAMKIDSQDNPPIFSVQKEFQPKVIVERYTVRTDVKENPKKGLVGKKFIPDFYTCKFVYNMITDKGEVHMERQVVDLLLKLLPEPLRSQLLFGIVDENSKEKVIL